ncbi:MAG: hypothetical protein M3N18_09890 [Actinomycetota bacterium]|nr:hypothetical protein [Actinomycetota bacterium]
MSETDVATTTPYPLGDAPAPKRNGSRGLLPSTWLGRSLRVAYVGVDGEGVETTGTLLDWCGVGPVFGLAGARVIVGWDRLVLIELVGD